MIYDIYVCDTFIYKELIICIAHVWSCAQQCQWPCSLYTAVDVAIDVSHYCLIVQVM